MPRTITACMVCQGTQLDKHKCDCPCCGKPIKYVYCEECGSMFIESANTDDTSLLEEDDDG